ncbi:MAG: serine/threonine-protein kinase [Planctomycetota bacterium]
MPADNAPLNNPASASAPPRAPATRLRCEGCGVEVRAVGWKPGMPAACKKCGKAMHPASNAPTISVADATANTLRPEAPDPLVGRSLGGCRISRKIGSGGMGAVYEGLHIGLDKKVAIKILPPEFTTHATALERFQREARAAAKLEHANIVQVLNVGNEGGYNFIVMQFVEGESLGKLVSRRRSVPWLEALKFVRDAARGLVSAHAAGVVHRDIKPDNILIAKDGVAKVADFGLARTLDSNVSLSTTGQIMGTPDYMSPEQAQAQKIDGRSDVYSLGATFYFLLSGKKPFHADTPLAIIMKHVSEAPRPLREINAEIPAAVANVISKMMAKKPEDRFPDCAAVVAALDELERGGTPVSSGSLPSVPSPGGLSQVILQPESSARGLLFVGAGIAGVLLFAVIVVAMVKSRREVPAAPARPPEATPAVGAGPAPDPPTTDKKVLDLYRTLTESIAAREWRQATDALKSLRMLSETPAYKSIEADVLQHADQIRIHVERVASGVLTDLPGGAERYTFEFDGREGEADFLETRLWSRGMRPMENGFLVGNGFVAPKGGVAMLDGTLRARMRFIERAKRVKDKPGGNKPRIEEALRSEAWFGFRVQESGVGWVAGVEDEDGDRVRAVIQHLTQSKPLPKTEEIKAAEIPLAGDVLFDIAVTFKGKHISMSVNDKEVVAVDDAWVSEPGNLVFHARGPGVKIDRLVFERSK